MRKKIISLLGGNIVFVGSQWLIVVILTKYVGLTAAGIYALSLAIVSPIYTLTNLGLRPVAATDVEGENDLGDFVTLAMIGNLVAVLASITLAKVAFPDEAVDLVVLYALIASKTIESFSFIFYGFFQQHARITDVSRSLTVRGLLGLLTVSVLLVLTGTYRFALYGLAVAWIFVLWRLDYQVIKRLQLKATWGKDWARRWRDVRRLFLTAFPLGVLASFNILSVQIPRYFVADYLSIETLGIYAGIAYLALMGATLVNAIGQTIIGRLAVLFRSDRKKFATLQVKALIAGLVVGVLGILLAWTVGDLLLEFIYSAEFSSFGNIFVLAMVWSAIMFLSALTGSALSGMRLFKEQSYVGGIVLLTSFASSYYLIKISGLEGAFYSLILSSIVKLVLQMIILLKKYKEEPQKC